MGVQLYCQLPTEGLHCVASPLGVLEKLTGSPSLLQHHLLVGQQKNSQTPADQRMQRLHLQ